MLSFTSLILFLVALTICDLAYVIRAQTTINPTMAPTEDSSVTAEPSDEPVTEEPSDAPVTAEPTQDPTGAPTNPGSVDCSDDAEVWVKGAEYRRGDYVTFKDVYYKLKAKKVKGMSNQRDPSKVRKWILAVECDPAVLPEEDDDDDIDCDSIDEWKKGRYNNGDQVKLKGKVYTCDKKICKNEPRNKGREWAVEGECPLDRIDCAAIDEWNITDKKKYRKNDQVQINEEVYLCKNKKCDDIPSEKSKKWSIEGECEE